MESLALILMVIFGFVLARSWLDQRDKHAQARMRFLEQATAQGMTAPGELERMVDSSVKSRVPTPLALLLLAGWICIFVGTMLWLLSRDPDTKWGGIITAVVGTALASYPFALQELETRRLRG